MAHRDRAISTVISTRCDENEDKRKVDGLKQEICGNKNPDAKKRREVDGNNCENTNFVNNSDGAVDVEKAASKNHPIFATDLVMLKILGYLSFKDLLRCREVSSSFNSHALEIINLRRSHRVRFSFDWEEYMYISRRFVAPDGEVTQLSRNSITIFDFAKILTLTTTTSPHIFCDSFKFCGGSLLDPGLQNFLHDHGHKVKELAFQVHLLPQDEDDDDSDDDAEPFTDQIIPPPEKSCLAYLLTNQVPNLAFLELGDCPRKWSIEAVQRPLFHNSHGEKILLPNLKVLRIQRNVPKSIFSDILEAAINLKEVYCYNGADVVMKARKFQYLKTILFKPNENSIEDYEAIFPSTQCTAEFFMFGTYNDDETHNRGLQSRILKSLTKVLIAGSSTLKEIWWNPQIAFRPRDKTQIPTLPKVKAIKFQIMPFVLEGVDNERMWKPFPVGFQFVDSFPNLTYVRFEIGKFCKDWDIYFDDDYFPVPTVKNLCIYSKNYHLPSTWFCYLSALFPNIEILHIRVPIFSIADAASCGLWSFGKLKKLKLYIDLDNGYNNYPLDSAFTGFSFETCKQLYNSPGIVDASAIEKLRVFPSIHDLKMLEELHLSFSGSSCLIQSSYLSILTNVSALYAFHSLPQLNVYTHLYLVNPENNKLLSEALKLIFPHGYHDFPNCDCNCKPFGAQWQLTGWMETFPMLE